MTNDSVPSSTQAAVDHLRSLLTKCFITFDVTFPIVGVLATGGLGAAVQIMVAVLKLQESTTVICEVLGGEPLPLVRLLVPPQAMPCGAASPPVVQIA